MTDPVRVRFAPSPTGRLHIGGARTALFNWAFARANDGAFILRVEDTDSERNSEDSLHSILASMRWLGLDWDEGPEAGGAAGPYFQSERRDSYQAGIERGLAEGWLYRCFATSDEIQALRDAHREQKAHGCWASPSRDLDPATAERRAADGESCVLRFRVPLGEEILVRDHIRGEVRFRSDEVEDWVAVRSNGMPTYNFCCALDDDAMRISHVIRGEEHLVNTPKQILLAQAMSLRVPDFAHVPLILGEDGKKLSKRTGDTALGDYIDKGYPPEAMFNFLALLGFSIDDKTTVFNREELLAHFDLKRISKGGALFDTAKLHFLCAEYIRHTEPAELAQRLQPWLDQAGLQPPSMDSEQAGSDSASTSRKPWLETLANAFRERLGLYSELPDKAAFLFSDHVEIDDKAQKALDAEGAQDLLLRLAEALEQEPLFPPADWSAWIKNQAAIMEVGMGKLMKPMRAALSGTLGGPELADILVLLGRDRVLQRLRGASVRS